MFNNRIDLYTDITLYSLVKVISNTSLKNIKERFIILGVQAAQWAVLQLISIRHSWQDSTDHWFEGLVYFRLIFNRMQIKDLAFSDKFLIDCKGPLHYQLQDKWVLKKLLFSEGRLYQCISDGLNCCTSLFRLTALIVGDVPGEVVK